LTFIPAYFVPVQSCQAVASHQGGSSRQTSCVLEARQILTTSDRPATVALSGLTAHTSDNMEEQEHHIPGHYSGQNRIPNIKQFVESLDRDKKIRDAQIDQDMSANNASGIPDHQNKPKKKKGKMVQDPVTGKEVEIADVDLDFKEAVEHPKVSLLARTREGEQLLLNNASKSCPYRTPILASTRPSRPKHTSRARNTDTIKM
jgi:hypothetical protein